MDEGLLTGKRGVIFGVANERSIAWSCAKACQDQGDSLIFSYLGKPQERRLRKLLDGAFPRSPMVHCDVSKDEEITVFFEEVAKAWDRVDFIIHSIAYARSDDLSGHFINTSRAGFMQALDISSYSLVGIARQALPLMKAGGSIVTMTYYGSEKVVPRYNVMGVAKAALETAARYLAFDLGPRGVRVNCLSAGPIRTLSSHAIPGMHIMMDVVEQCAPLRRNVSPEEVAKTAVYLVSDLASAVTGEVLHVDCGYNTLGMFGLEPCTECGAPRIAMRP